jgi:hypothetical protein
MECVYCAVRTESLYIPIFTFVFKGLKGVVEFYVKEGDYVAPRNNFLLLSCVQSFYILNLNGVTYLGEETCGRMKDGEIHYVFIL